MPPPLERKIGRETVREKEAKKKITKRGIALSDDCLRCETASHRAELISLSPLWLREYYSITNLSTVILPKTTNT